MPNSVIKDAIVARIREALLNSKWKTLNVEELPGAGSSVIVLKVKIGDEYARYFTIKVTENQ